MKQKKDVQKQQERIAKQITEGKQRELANIAALRNPLELRKKELEEHCDKIDKMIQRNHPQEIIKNTYNIEQLYTKMDCEQNLMSTDRLPEHYKIQEFQKKEFKIEQGDIGVLSTKNVRMPNDLKFDIVKISLLGISLSALAVAGYKLLGSQ